MAYKLTALLLACILLTSSCSGAGNSTQQIVLVGSTPGDELIKSILSIPADKKVDFIRWNLTLNNTNAKQNTFSLDIVFGEAQPNTLGFKGGGEKRSFEGAYTVSQSKKESSNGEIYHLKSSKLPTEIKMIKLNDNIFHLLTPQNRLMIGNGGWSYTLNRKEIIDNTTTLPALTTSSSLLNDTSRQVVFDGRTPCQNFAAEHQWNVSSSCFKLKWRLVLNRDPISHEPTTYTIRKVVDNAPRDVSGRWTIIRGTQENPNAIIYKLDPEDPKKSISLLVGDENVIFLLNRNYELYAGNSDFSFTLNKKQ
jgi:hypothetical protein